MTKEDRRWFIDSVMPPSLPIPQWLIDQAKAVYEFEQLCRKLGLDAEHLLPLIRKEAEHLPASLAARIEKWVLQIVERPPYTVVISKEYRRAEYELTHREFPINPRGRSTIIITQAWDGMRKLRGHRFNEAQGDRLIWESGPARSTMSRIGEIDELVHLLRRSGLTVP